MKQQYLGNNLGSPNSSHEHYDFYEDAISHEDWKCIVNINHDGSTCRIKGLTVKDAAELLYNLQQGKELRAVRYGGYEGPGSFEYALHFSDEELAYPIDEYAYNSELGLFHIPLKKFRCDKCGKEIELRTLEKSFDHKSLLSRKCGGTYRE